MVFSFVLPFYFKFGHRMMRLLLVSLGGLGIVAQVVLMYVLSRLEDARSGQIVVVSAVLRFFESSGELGRNLWFAATGLVIFVVSYLVCLRIFKRQDL